MLVSGLCNIDERIMRQALTLLLVFLQGNSGGQQVFMELSGAGHLGLSALAGCLWDYNVDIQLKASDVPIFFSKYSNSTRAHSAQVHNNPNLL